VDKDLFEIQLKEQLTQMKAPVPEGSWAAIKSQISTPGAYVPGSGVSTVSFGVGIAAGAIILTSLGVYSELKDNQLNEPNIVEKPLVEESSLNEVETDPSTDVINYQEAEKVSQNQDDEVSSKNELPFEENEMENPAVEILVDENISAQEKADEVPEFSITPMTKIDSNGLSTDNSSVDSEERAPVTSIPTTEPAAATETIEAEIVTSVHEGFAPLSVKMDNVVNIGESVWQIDDRTYRGSMVETVFEEPGTYNVYLMVYDDDGNLKAEDQTKILVKEGSDIKLPNIFTPNGDGLNDTYRIGYAKNINELFIRITDQAGRVVYSSNDISEEWIYDQGVGSENTRYTVQYRAIGVDGKVHTDQFPLIIVTD